MATIARPAPLPGRTTDGERVPSSMPPKARIQVRRTRVIALGILTIISFVLSYSVERRFAATGGFAQYNVFFDADPNLWLPRIANGWGAVDFKHLNATTFLNPPVRVAAAIAHATHFSSLAPEALRESIALLVVPLLSALRTVVLFSLFAGLGLSLPATSSLCLLDMFSFSRVVFGSVPESFAISGTIIATLFWLAARNDRISTRWWWAAWIALSTLAIGITVTNVIPVACVLAMLAIRSPNPRWTIVARAIAVIVAAFAINFAFARIESRVYGEPATLGYNPQADEFVHLDPVEAGAELRWAVPNTFLAPRPSTRPNSVALQAKSRYGFMFTYATPEASPSQWLTAGIVLLMLIGGALGFRYARDDRLFRALAVTGVVIVMVNLGMHLAFGSEYFLYTQHWEVPLLICIAGITLHRDGDRRVALSALFSFTAAVGVVSLTNIASMLERLAS
ncbi:MAG TPA: hypothetical protein VGQ30_00990 [Gemmatimonadaceae bacterium]|nr:hypothetical protein [Gemmatimonadaceae bacterium]